MSINSKKRPAVGLFFFFSIHSGIEFSSGTQATLKFRDDALIEDQLSNDGLVRERINSQATEAAAGATDEGKRKTLQKLIATARVETLINENRVQEFLSLYGNDKGQVTMTEWIEKIMLSLGS
ncbi:MAG TPA: hypothetical protein ENH84_01905, partial [Phycisphaerae bacterium]|nr:hypothetical protein [Phycisphaerae bacterium]